MHGFWIVAWSTLAAVTAGVSVSSAHPLEEVTALYRLHYNSDALTQLKALETQQAVHEFSGPASILKGKLLLRTGDTQGGIPALKKACMKEDHLSPYACKALIDGYLEVEDSANAQAIIGKSGLDKTERYIVEARLAELEDKPKLAIKRWNQVLRSKKKGAPFSTARERLADLEARTNPGASKGHLKRLVIHWPHTPEGLRATENYSLDKLSHGESQNRAQRLWDVRMYPEAYAAYDRLRQHQATRDEANLMMGRLLSERMRDRYPEAIAHFEACHRAKDRDLAGTCLYKKGIALGKVHKYDEAIETLRLFRKKFPSNRNAAEAGFEVGRHLMESGDFNTAMKHLEKWVKGEKRLRDKNKYLWFAAWAAYRGEFYEDAIRIMAPMRKSNRTLVGDKALYWTAKSYDRLGKKKQAADMFERCIKRFPMSYYTWHAMESLALPSDHPYRTLEFGAVEPVDEAPWAHVLEARAEMGEPLVQVMDLILIGELKGANERWEKLGASKKMKRKLGKRWNRINASMQVLLENHYTGRKAAFKKYRSVRQRWPKEQSIEQWRALFPRAFRSLTRKVASREQLPEWLLYAHMLQESRYGTHMISGADARGVLQILPSTARKIASDIGVPYREEWLYDGAYNIRLAAWYLGALNKRFQGQTPLASASYNGGPLLLSFIMKQYPSLEMVELIESMPTHQARNYVRKVIEHFHRYLGIYCSASQRDEHMRKLFPRKLSRVEETTPDY